MKNKVDSLYIHIPFCKSICTYCDFVRKVAKCQKEEDDYIDKICNQINEECKGKFKTIYIGGGTPNSLSQNNLNLLLATCKKFIAKDCEFTIECNPEFINQDQVDIFKKFGVNRISLGVQTLNEKVNKIFNRKHTNKDIINAIELLRKNKIENISLDFIYGYHLIKQEDIENNLKFIINNKIPHCSFYSLEIKENSVLAKQKYQLDDEIIDQEFKFIIDMMKKYKYQRYEISNWCIDKKHQCQHNLAYWNTNDWKAIGLGAYGLENRNYYYYSGNTTNLKKINTKYNDKDYYFQVIMMGFRLIKGLDLKNPIHLKAFNFYKDKIDSKLITVTKDNVKVKNVNKLDDILISLI